MNEELNQTIVVASEEGDLDTVKNALTKGADPNAMGANFGALHSAAFNGHESIVDLLIKSGADVTLKDNRSFCPLHLAASKGYISISNLLIEAGADLEAVTSAGGTALHVAASCNFREMVVALVKAGANLEARDTNGLTPLAAAASLGGNEIVKELLKLGADANTKDNKADTVLMKALRCLFTSRIKEWSNTGVNNGKDAKYEVIKGCFRYDEDYDPNNETKLGTLVSLEDQRNYSEQLWGPSDHLMYLNAFDAAKLLIEAGVDLNLVNDSGQTAMGIACRVGESKMIRKLYENGANFDCKNDQNITPLHQVAGSGRIDGLEAFFELTQPSDINTVDRYGWTALHYLADIGGHPSMVTLLLDNGADRTIKSTDTRGEGIPFGSTPAAVAEYWKDTKLADLLK